jgi:hypothetical protein
LSHHFGQFVDPIVKVRAIVAKLLKSLPALARLALLAAG